MICEDVHKRKGPEILGIRDARGSLCLFRGGAGRGRRKNFRVGRREAGRKSSERGGATFKLGAFSGYGGAGQS